jgi:hypothetical protein
MVAFLFFNMHLPDDVRLLMRSAFIAGMVLDIENTEPGIEIPGSQILILTKL